MSLAFRVFSLPRSGSAWVANWLTDCHSICWHEPLFEATPKDIELWADKQQRIPGIACTGSWLLGGLRTDIPTICLHRRLVDIQQSLYRLNLPMLPMLMVQKFNRLPFMKVGLEELLDPEGAEAIYEFLMPGMPFDAERHRHVSRFRVQCDDDRITEARQWACG